MSRDTFTYTHGDTGTKPGSALNFESNERPNADNFDWYWYAVIQAIKGHADEFDRLDSDDDGVVDKADNADQLDGNDSSYFLAASNKYTDENAQDAINNLLVGGTNVSLTYDDGNDSLEIVSTDTNLSDEAVEDIVGTLVAGGTGIGVNYDDANNSLDITVNAGDISLSDLGSKAHSSLTGVGTDDHHSQNHDNSDHTTNYLPSSNYDPEADTHSKYTDENAQDAVNALLSGGSNVSVSYDDGNNTLTISSTDTDTNLSDEEVEDIVGTLISAGSGINVNYDDSNNSLTVSNASSILSSSDVDHNSTVGGTSGTPHDHADPSDPVTQFDVGSMGDGEALVNEGGTLTGGSAGGGGLTEITPDGYTVEAGTTVAAIANDAVGDLTVNGTLNVDPLQTLWVYGNTIDATNGEIGGEGVIRER